VEFEKKFEKMMHKKTAYTYEAFPKPIDCTLMRTVLGQALTVFRLSALQNCEFHMENHSGTKLFQQQRRHRKDIVDSLRRPGLSGRTEKRKQTCPVPFFCYLSLAYNIGTFILPTQ
jgi:hypothetical protein